MILFQHWDKWHSQFGKLQRYRYVRLVLSFLNLST